MLGVLWCSKGPSNPIATCNAYIVRGWTDAWRLSISLLSVRSTWCPLFRNRGIKRWVFCCIRLNDRSIPMTMIGWKDEFSWHDCLHLFWFVWGFSELVIGCDGWNCWGVQKCPHMSEKERHLFMEPMFEEDWWRYAIRLFLFQLLLCNQR